MSATKKRNASRDGTSGNEQQQTYTRQEISWDPGVEDMLRSYKLNDQTIIFLGTEEFTTLEAIDDLDIDIANRIEDKYNLSLRQVAAMKKMINNRNISDKQMNHRQLPESTADEDLMCDEKKDILLTQASTISTHLSEPATYIIINSLCSQKCIDEQELESLKKIITVSERVWELLSIIRKKTNKDFWSLVRTFWDTDKSHLSNLLLKNSPTQSLIGKIRKWLLSNNTKLITLDIQYVPFINH